MSVFGSDAVLLFLITDRAEGILYSVGDKCGGKREVGANIEEVQLIENKV